MYLLFVSTFLSYYKDIEYILFVMEKFFILKKYKRSGDSPTKLCMYVCMWISV